jgi:hypothetical protein
LQRAREIALEDRAAMAAAAPVTLTQLLHWQQRLLSSD